MTLDFSLISRLRSFVSDCQEASILGFYLDLDLLLDPDFTLDLKFDSDCDFDSQ